MALATVAIPATPVSKAPQPGNPSIWQRVDALGAALGVSALILFNFAWNQGPVVGWPTPYTYSIMIVGLLIFVAFFLVEKRISTHPLIPFGILHMDSTFSLACIAAGWSSFGIIVFYALNFLELLRGLTPLLTSAQLAPVALSGLTAAGATGFCLTHFKASTVMLLAMSFFLIGGIIIGTMPVHQTYWAQTFVGLIVLPWGMDMSFPAGTIILSRAMPREHQGLGASLVNTFVNYSISIGLGFAGTVESQVNDKGRNVLRGFRGAFYMAIGLASLGVCTALVFCLVEQRQARRKKEVVEEEMVKRRSMIA